MDQSTDILGIAHLAEKHQIALNRAIAFIEERYQPIGAIATGSIIRGTAHPSSDFDIVVAHLQDWRQRHQR